MEDDFTIYKDKNLFADCLSTLREIRRQGRLCDIVLKVEKVEKLFSYDQLNIFIPK